MAGVDIALSDRQKAIWMLTTIEGERYEQVAAALKLSLAVVKVEYERLTSILNNNTLTEQYIESCWQKRTVAVEFDDLMIVREALRCFQFVAENFPKKLIWGTGARSYQHHNVDVAGAVSGL